ncbi:hypothetical protein Tco_1447743 [Tanacetum coccineum]
MSICFTPTGWCRIKEAPHYSLRGAQWGLNDPEIVYKITPYHFTDVAGSGVESSGLIHDESFGVDDLDLDLDLNEPMLVEVYIVAEVRTQEPTVEDVVLEDCVSFAEDAKQANG